MSKKQYPKLILRKIPIKINHNVNSKVDHQLPLKKILLSHNMMQINKTPCHKPVDSRKKESHRMI
jgi:hypothetical protein